MAERKSIAALEDEVAEHRALAQERLSWITTLRERIAALEQQLAEAVADREVLARFFYKLNAADVSDFSKWTAQLDAANVALDLGDIFGELTETGERLAELGFEAEQRAAGGDKHG